MSEPPTRLPLLNPPGAHDLKDEADLREAGRTKSGDWPGRGPIEFSLPLGIFLLPPLKSLDALGAAFRLQRTGPAIEGAVISPISSKPLGSPDASTDWTSIMSMRISGPTLPGVGLLLPALGDRRQLYVHGPNEFDAPIALSLRAKIDAASFVAAISGYGRSQLMRWRSPAQWSKIGVVRCGLDREVLEATTRPASLDSTGISAGRRLSPQKGLPLIDACDRLRKAADASLTILGGGPLRQALKTDVCHRKLNSFVTFASVRSSEQIREHLDRARVFVLPSCRGLPVILMEALALARPVITTAHRRKSRIGR